MKPKKQTKDYRRLFEWHGVEFTRESGDELVGTAPFSVKPNKFYLNVKTGKWSEFQTGDEGNAYGFLARMADLYREDITDAALQRLARVKGLPFNELRRWDFGVDVEGRLTLAWKNAKGTVCDIRRFDNGKWYSSPECNTQLLGVRKLVKAKAPGTAWVCEGEVDGVALRYCLRRGGRPSDVVVVVPGAGTFKAHWVKHFAGWTVYLCYDHDKAGQKGREKALKVLGDVPAAVRALQWPDDKPDGYDVRDLWLLCEKKPEEVLWQLQEWLAEAPGPAPWDDDEDFDEVDPAEAPTFDETLAVYRKHLHMTPDLERALELSVAVTLSAPLPGDPLWLQQVAPPGGGKTTLLDKLGASRKAVVVSTVTPRSLVSGMNRDPDPSLLPKLNRKCFVWKDATELMDMHPSDRDEIHSALRGAYDGRVFKAFGNGVVREYENLRFSMLMGVTPAIHGERKTSLGERFLKFQMTDVTTNPAAQIAAAISQVAQEDKMNAALREVTKRFLARRVDGDALPLVPQRYVDRVVALSQLIGLLRAQVDRNQWTGEVRYRPVAELGTRLAKQLVKLAKVLAVVRDKAEVDDEVWRLVERVAFDTATGFHLEVVQALVALGGSATRNQIEEKLALPMTNLSRKLNDLQLLKVFRKEKQGGPREGRRHLKSDLWHLTKKVRRLWDAAEVEQDHAERAIKVRRRRPKRKKTTLRKKQTKR